MREDLKKIILKSPQYTRGRKNPRKNKDIEDVHGSTVKMWGGELDKRGAHKFSTPVLKRYLNSQVGKAWNDIYSDLAKNGIIKVLQSTYYDIDSILKWDGFYIENGILKKEKKKKYKKPEEEDPIKKIDGRYFVQKNDIWYELKMKSILHKYRSDETIYRVYDKGYECEIVFEIINYNGELLVESKNKYKTGWYSSRKIVNYDQDDIYCAALRQISKVEKKRLGLL